MATFYRLCPQDSHTCTTKICLEVCHFTKAVETVIKAVDKETPVKPDKDDPMTWEVKES